MTKIYTLNAFAKTPEGGNPAGVVLDAEKVPTEERQKIAKKLGLSETAFVEKSQNQGADFKLEFFTPNSQVDLCGHATIAAFSLMVHLNRLKIGKYVQETGVGLLGIEIRPDYTVIMDQKLPEFFEAIDREKVAESLNIPVDQVIDNLPVQIISTGARDIMVPIKTLKDILAIRPDLKKITAISQKYNALGYQLFTPETKLHSTAHCRNFSPACGIPEDPATGTSSGALACYLFKHGKISNKQAKRLIFEQGYCVQKPSEIMASLTIKDGKITAVKIGGKAQNIQGQN